MLLTVDNMVSILRSSVNIQNEDVVDTAYLSMSDDDIKLFIKLGVSRAYPDVTDLSDLPDGSEYPVVTLAKIELYLKLATIKADKIDMGADNNNYLKQDQRFQHYMKMVEELREEYQQYLDNEGEGVVSTYDVLLSDRHYTHRNYEKQVAPVVSLNINTITSDSVSLSWKMHNSSHFGRFKLYVSESPIIDIYLNGSTYKDKLSGDPTLVLSTSDIRNTSHRLEGLTPETLYYVAIISIERNQVFGYSEKSFTTLAELEDEEEVSSEVI